VTSATFSPDGKRIVTASEDKSVRMWEADSGKQIGVPLTGHTETVREANFSPDGKRILSASDDSTVRLWEAKSSKQIGEPAMGHQFLTSAAFSPDGKRIVSRSVDKKVQLSRIFPGGTEEIVAVAKAASPRCLTAEQRQQFFLPAQPPAWCIEQEKWPYDTLAWKQWLRDSRTNKGLPLPPAP
jgi:Tol biopolymer transport system component